MRLFILHLLVIGFCCTGYAQLPRLIRNDDRSLAYQSNGAAPQTVVNEVDGSNLKHGGWVEYFKGVMPSTAEEADRIYIIDYFHGSSKDVYEFNGNLTLLRKLKLQSVNPLLYGDGEQVEYSATGKVLKTLKYEKGDLTSITSYNGKGEVMGTLAFYNKDDFAGVIQYDYGMMVVAKPKTQKNYGILISSEFEQNGFTYKLTEEYQLEKETLRSFLNDGYSRLFVSGTYKISDSKTEKVLSEGTMRRNLCSSNEFEHKETKNYQSSLAHTPTKTPNVEPKYYSQQYGKCKYCNKTIAGVLKTKEEIKLELGMMAMAYAFEASYLMNTQLMTDAEKAQEGKRMLSEMGNIRINRYKINDFCSLKCRAEYETYLKQR